MMDRCYRKKARNYPTYGGRGILVCDEWHDIEAFEQWVKTSGFCAGLTIERKDVNGNYCPENCTWATLKEQANNRRNTVFLELNGERHTMTEWAAILGINRGTISSRVYRGWSAEKALSRRV